MRFNYPPPIFVVSNGEAHLANFIEFWSVFKSSFHEKLDKYCALVELWILCLVPYKL